MTIDVEEYFHIEAARGVVGRDQWDRWPSRVERNVDLLLSLLQNHNRRGTFFVLGDVAKKHPGLARRVAEAGHEIASHGTNHDRLHRLDPQAFREDVRAGKRLLEDQVGQAVLGYRAPTFSVVPETAWAIDVLSELGFEYDASIFPVRHPWYGVPTAPAWPFWVQGKSGGERMLEVPPLTWGVGGGKNLPVAGGGYFRMFPLWMMRKGLSQAARQDRPAVLYFHPWEFDPDMPRMPLKGTRRLRTYWGLGAAANRLEKIVREPAAWLPIRDCLPRMRQTADAGPVFRLDQAAA